jgi:hypothetical protein
LRAYAALCATIYQRTGPLLGLLLAHGPGSDVGLQEFVATIDRERRAGNRNALNALDAAHGLPTGLERERFIDIVWTITAPEIYDRFVRRCGWTHPIYAAWLAEALVAIFEHEGAGRVADPHSDSDADSDSDSGSGAGPVPLQVPVPAGPPRPDAHED